MKSLTLKNIGILAILIVIILSSCEVDEFSIYPPFDNREEFQFQTEQTFCKSDPGNEISTKSFKYDKNGNIIETTTFYKENPDSKSTNTFNNNNQKLSDSTFFYGENGWKYEYSNQYKYSRNLLIEILKYDSDGINTHKTVYTYNGTKKSLQ